MNQLNKLLILGASGLVGQAIIQECQKDYDIYGTYNQTPAALPDHQQFQLPVEQGTARMTEIVQHVNPDFVISSLRGDFQHQLALHQQLVATLKSMDTKLLFLSTTNVFDGDDSKLHTELDPPNPVSDYGKFKLNCEQLIQRELQDRSLIIRLPQIWGKQSPRMNQIRERLHNQEAVSAFRNLVRTGLLDTTLAKQLRYLMESGATGVFHLTSTDATTDEQFIKEIVSNITDKEDQVNGEFYKDGKETYYFGLRSVRNELPASLLQSNEDIIKSLSIT